MDIKQENALFQTLGRIESKVEGMCIKNKERHLENKMVSKKLDDFLENLPCHEQYQICQKDINTKVSGTIVKAIAGALFILACGAYGYTYMIDDNIDNHAQDYNIHYLEHDNDSNN